MKIEQCLGRADAKGTAEAGSTPYMDDDEDLFSYTDFFVTTVDKLLRAYQRMVFSMNLPSRVRHVYFEQLGYLDPKFMHEIEEVQHIGESIGWEKLIRHLKYRNNPFLVRRW